MLCSDHSKTVSRAVGVDNGLLAFGARDALPVLHAEHSFEAFRVNVTEYVLVVYLARAGLFPTWVIAYVESSDVLPGFVDVGNQITFADLLVIQIIYNLAARVVHAFTNQICLRDIPEETPRMICPPIQRFDGSSATPARPNCREKPTR